MRLEPDSPRRADEERRYFPDWTEPLVEVCEEIEADHNSYLAGGYAEEFGYRAQAGSSRGVPVLDGELPEESEEWHHQAGSTHPGYPIQPRPLALDGEQTANVAAATSKPQLVVPSFEASFESQPESVGHGAFIRVTDRPYAQGRHHPEQRVAAMFTRLLAALVTLRWGLPHSRRGRS
jgi:hypothetical protein